MIMRPRAFLYNAVIFRIFNDLQSSKVDATPVGQRLGTCLGPVHKFIHSFLHRFYPPIRPGFSTGSYNPRQFSARIHVTP
jgi:hypothetical protein